MEFDIQVICKNEIYLVKTLWEKLNKINHDSSPFFKHEYSFFTFEERIRKILRLDENDVRIFIAKISEKELIGYCITTIQGNSGEIDSIFVEQKYRYMKTGEKLVLKSLEWLKKRGCGRIFLNISYGNETAIGFYEKFGFRPRHIRMEMKE